MNKLFRTVNSLITYSYFLGEHAATMHEEHVRQLHQAQAHHTRRVHLRWTGFLDTAGIKFYRHVFDRQGTLMDRAQ